MAVGESGNQACSIQGWSTARTDTSCLDCRVSWCRGRCVGRLLESSGLAQTLLGARHWSSAWYTRVTQGVASKVDASPRPQGPSQRQVGDGGKSHCKLNLRVNSWSWPQPYARRESEAGGDLSPALGEASDPGRIWTLQQWRERSDALGKFEGSGCKIRKIERAFVTINGVLEVHLQQILQTMRREGSFLFCGQTCTKTAPALDSFILFNWCIID